MSFTDAQNVILQISSYGAYQTDKLVLEKNVLAFTHRFVVLLGGIRTPHCFLLLVLSIRDTHGMCSGLIVGSNAHIRRHRHAHFPQWALDFDFCAGWTSADATIVRWEGWLDDIKGDPGGQRERHFAEFGRACWSRGEV